MKYLVLIGLVLGSGAAVAEKWEFTPHIYSRGGVTLNRPMTKEQSDYKAFNFGPWLEESNSMNGSLTELTLESSLGGRVKHFYGVSTDNNSRFLTPDVGAEENKEQLSERINYVEFIDGNRSIWFGQRPYRGDGEFLTGGFPFDEHNMLGGGIRYNELGPVNVEFAYGVKRGSNDATTGVATTPYTTNIVINKVEYPLSKGRIKSNLEYHQTNYFNETGDDKVIGLMAGVQLQDWDRSLLGGNLYNIVLVNYSSGHIYGGAMRCMFDSTDPDTPASKLVMQWAGDWKAGGYGVYFVNRYSQHMGKDGDNGDGSEILSEADMTWATYDAIIRPQYALTSNWTLGVEYAKRTILTEGEGVPDWGKNQGAVRHAGMVAYNPKDNLFGTPVIRLFAGTMKRDNETEYFSGDNLSKTRNFFRLSYEVSVN
jgi:hypothetical protein